MRHTFLVVTVKMVKIGVHLRKLSQKLKPLFRLFLEHPVYLVKVTCIGRKFVVCTKLLNMLSLLVFNNFGLLKLI